MNLLDRTARVLVARRGGFAVIGAAALAVQGVARSTQDLDVLVADRRCLDVAYWTPLTADGVRVVVHPGDATDPLAGVARLRAAGEPALYIVVAKPQWQADVIGRAVPARVAGVEVPVATAPDLILLKLYAGGPQDAWDIVQLLGLGDASVAAEVRSRLGELPADARELWTRLTNTPA